jgi:7-cyano-7-deazaguanine synthase
MGRAFAPRHPGRESWRHHVRRPDAVVALTSGGLDSCALIAHLAGRGREVFPLYLKAGMIWEKAERHWLARFLRALPPGIGRKVRPLKVVSLPMSDLYGDHWSTTGKGIPGWRATDSSVYLPGRNIILLAKGAVHAAMIGVPCVAIGTLKGNPFPDASPVFLRSLQRALSRGLDYPIRIEAPFLRMEKEDLIARHAELPLGLSFSCSDPRGTKACLRCAKCRERALAFRGRTRP